MALADKIRCRVCGSGRQRIVSGFIRRVAGKLVGKFRTRCLECNHHQTVRVSSKKQGRAILRIAKPSAAPARHPGGRTA